MGKDVDYGAIWVEVMTDDGSDAKSTPVPPDQYIEVDALQCQRITGDYELTFLRFNDYRGTVALEDASGAPVIFVATGILARPLLLVSGSWFSIAVGTGTTTGTWRLTIWGRRTTLTRNSP